MTRRDVASARRMSAVPDTLRWGVGLALGAALISGFSVIVNAAAVRQFPDPAVYTTLKNGVATVILACLVASGPGPRAVRAMDRRAWARLTVIGIVGGSVPFLLFFTGLAQASAPSAAFIQKTLFVWVAVLAVPFLGERLGWVQVAALGLLLAGQALVAPPSGLAWGGGETLIAAATLLWAIEVVLAKRLLESVAVPLVAAGRLGLGMVVLIAYLATTGRLGILADLRTDHWLSTLITGAILAAYVAMWLGALRRAPAGLVTAVLVVGAPITAVVEAMMTRGAFPDAPVVVGGLLIITASACLVGLSVRARAPSSKIEPGPAAA